MLGTSRCNTICFHPVKRGGDDVAQRRILRNFHNMPPGAFHVFNQRVVKSISDTEKISESVWAANSSVKANYLATSQKYDLVFHEASFGSRLVIAQREILQAQLVNYLDEIASLLEAAAVRNPEVLLSCGFDLSKERRGRPRAKIASEDSIVSNAEPPPSQTS
jgi:hypothetical protein